MAYPSKSWQQERDELVERIDGHRHRLRMYHEMTKARRQWGTSFLTRLTLTQIALHVLKSSDTSQDHTARPR